MSYYFDSTGGCELCDAMAGYYETEPCRPHPNCNCPIEDDSSDDEGNAVNFDWSYERGMTERDPERPNQAYIIPVEVTVECYSGRTMTDSTDVEFEESDEPEGDAVFDYIDDEVYEAAAELAEEMGADCPPVPPAAGEDPEDDWADA